MLKARTAQEKCLHQNAVHEPPPHGGCTDSALFPAATISAYSDGIVPGTCPRGP